MSTANIAGSFDLGAGAFTEAIQDIPGADWFRRPGESTNHLMWITGHIVVMWGMALNLLGPSPWADPWDGLSHAGRL